MRKFWVILLCLSLLSFSVPAMASPFGDDVRPLAKEELEEVDGEYKHIAVAGVVGGITATTNYLITTPKDDWSVRDASRAAIGGATSTAIGAVIGSWF